MAQEIKDEAPRVVIIGAGFAGLFCARGLLGSRARVTLIDRQNHHLFQPLLYQVAAGFLGINDVALPIRSLFPVRKNVDVAMEEVVGVDTKARKVRTNIREYPYDYLVIATGARYHFFGQEEWAEHCWLLKSLSDAIALRQRILTSFEHAEMEQDAARRAKLLTYVVIGGGPTGVEMAGAIADVVNYALKKEFRRIRVEDTRIVLLEAMPRVLGAMPDSLSAYAEKALRKKGVVIRANAPVRSISSGRVVIDGETIESQTIIWAAGVKPLPVSNWLGLEPDRRGAVAVNPDLSVPGLPNVYVLGDAASCMQDGKLLPALASVAKQQGKYLGKRLSRLAAGKGHTGPFRYMDLGTMATIGRNAAVAEFGRVTVRGWLAWMLWGVVHIFFLTGFKNRMTVFLTWVWTYLTYGMGARIILRTGLKEKPWT